uniref:Uncharacterized protein n=1 Tax=Anguilla anguilla TaxID=7936 RepID=A0A0E9VFG4_ANGAN
MSSQVAYPMIALVLGIVIAFASTPEFMEDVSVIWWVNYNIIFITGNR